MYIYLYRYVYRSYMYRNLYRYMHRRMCRHLHNRGRKNSVPPSFRATKYAIVQSARSKSGPSMRSKCVRASGRYALQTASRHF